MHGGPASTGFLISIGPLWAVIFCVSSRFRPRAKGSGTFGEDPILLGSCPESTAILSTETWKGASWIVRRRSMSPARTAREEGVYEVMRK